MATHNGAPVFATAAELAAADLTSGGTITGVLVNASSTLAAGSAADYVTEYELALADVTAGGTITGDLINASSTKVAAVAADYTTKYFVDQEVTAADVTAGGTITGDLINASSTKAATVAADYTTKYYVDQEVTAVDLTSGGTVTGALVNNSATKTAATDADYVTKYEVPDYVEATNWTPTVDVISGSSTTHTVTGTFKLTKIGRLVFMTSNTDSYATVRNSSVAKYRLITIPAGYVPDSDTVVGVGISHFGGTAGNTETGYHENFQYRLDSDGSIYVFRWIPSAGTSEDFPTSNPTYLYFPPMHWTTA